MGYVSTNDANFRSTVTNWLEESGEVSALIRYSHAGGSKSFEFFADDPAFSVCLANLPPRTCVTVFAVRQLPLRGTVDEAFIEQAKSSYIADTEYLIAGLDRIYCGAANWIDFSAGESVVELEEDLRDRLGARVAVGAYPPWLHDNDEVISAVVPHPDGSVERGVY